MRRIALVLIAAFACSKKPAPPGTGAGQTAPSRAAAGEPAATRPAPDDSGPATAEGRSRMLAMMTPGATLPVDKQIEKLQRLVTGNPDKLDAWVVLGEAWVRKARDVARPSLYANAGACADLVLGKDPAHEPALALKGLVLMNDHRFEEARQLMTQVLARKPDDPKALGTLSDALLELGRTKEAIDAAQRMVDLKPNLPSYSRAAHLQWLRADIPGAKESLHGAIDAGGDSKDTEPLAWVVVQAAMIFWNEGDVEGAETGFDQALKKLPAFPPALAGKGRVLIGKGDGKGAAALLEQSYKANPLIETGWLLGDARELAGDAAGAKQVRDEIERRGKAADPRTLALYLATKDQKHDEAAQLALDERNTRDDQYTEDTVAWALYRQGKLDEALTASAKACELGTRDARLWFHRGAIKLAKGDASGRELIRKALALNPRFDMTGQAEAHRLLAAPLAKGK